MFISEGGDLWTWGRGDAGQLGHGDLKHLPVPKMVERFAGECWVSVCTDAGGTWVWMIVFQYCRVTVTVRVCTEVFVFGTGKFGQLGLGRDCIHTSVPHLIPASSDMVPEDLPASVHCGYEHTVIASRSGALCPSLHWHVRVVVTAWRDR
jgi:RCC1 and BTB domain-containing protein